MSPGGLRIDGRLVLTERGEPDPTEEVTDGYDAFAADDEDRIVGLDMHFEGSRPPFWVREGWAREARYNPLPPGAD